MAAIEKIGNKGRASSTEKLKTWIEALACIVMQASGYRPALYKMVQAPNTGIHCSKAINK